MGTVNTHEVNLSVDKFNAFTQADYIILQAADIEVNDYVLFKQVITTESEEVTETGLFQMTQVKNVIKDEGLKDGYALLMVAKL